MKTEKINQSASPEFPGLTAVNTETIISGKGNLVLNANLQINGVFSGMIKLTGSLTVGPNARITGDIITNELIVHGHIIGSVNVASKASFYDKSSLSGRLTAYEADIMEGSRISGIRRITHISGENRNEVPADQKNTYNRREQTASRVTSPAFSI